jgi:hypothetical protein
MISQLLLFSLTAAGVMGFEEAKALADKQEVALSSAQSQELIASQGEVAGPAFAACMPVPPPKSLPNFTIVMSLDARGKVQATWLKGGAEFASCIERKFANATLFKPPSTPFLTSFEYTFEP